MKEAVDASSGDVRELAVADGGNGQPGQPGQRSQRQRLLERRRLQAEFQKKLLQRKVDESRLSQQSQWVVYGAALGASCLSTAVMHPVDTVKVRGGGGSEGKGTGQLCVCTDCQAPNPPAAAAAV